MPPLPAQKAPQALGRRGVSPARGDGAKGQGPNANAMFAPVCGLMAWRVVRFTQGLGGWKSQCHARRHAVTCWSAECAWQIFPQGPMACGPNGVFSLMHAPWTTCHTLSRHALGGRVKHAFGPRAAEVIPRAFGPRVRDGKMHASGPRETISHAFGPHARENVARRFKAMRWPDLTIHPRARETQTTTRLRASRQE